LSQLPVAEALSRIRARIAAAARRAGRNPTEIGLVAVTKGVSADRIREAVAAGISCIGENRLQEAVSKSASMADLDLDWHLIGHLQRNKAPKAVGRFSLIHSVDSEPLLRALSEHVTRQGVGQRVLIQVNVARDPDKRGFAPEDLASALNTAERLPGIQVDGLMTVPAYDPDPEAARPAFRALADLRDRVAPGLEELSMGMTGDFEVAVEEGATLVRIGTGIFGNRS